MCNVCFPTCGRCRPISIVTFVCLECGRADSMSREEYLMYTGRPHRLSEAEERMLEENAGAPRLCKGCGSDLRETLDQKIAPAMCRRSNIQCGFPCGRHIQDPGPGSPCATMVPVGAYVEEEAACEELESSSGAGLAGRPGSPARPGAPGRPGTPSAPGSPS